MIEEIDLERPPPPDSEDQGPITSQNYIDCFQKKKKSQLQVSEMKPTSDPSARESSPGAPIEGHRPRAPSPGLPDSEDPGPIRHGGRRSSPWEEEEEEEESH